MFQKLYWLLPLISALVWCGMLLGLLLNWVRCSLYTSYTFRLSRLSRKKNEEGSREVKPKWEEDKGLCYSARSIEVPYNEAATKRAMRLNIQC